MTDQRAGRHLWLQGLLVLTIASALVALLIAATGGFDSRVLGVRIRARAWDRPALLALAGACVLGFHWRVLIARGSSAAWDAVQTVTAARLLVGIAAVWTVMAAAAFSSNAVGGSDSYGYVSQARLLAHGQLTDTVPAAGFSWPDVDATLTPLAYRRGQAPGVIAPTYPPGLPLLMAPFERAGRGVYLVVPLFALLLLWLTYRAGATLGSPLAGGVAALLLSCSPTFLFQSLQPMSDVPASACWLAALCLAWRRSSVDAATAGVVAAIAILIRPNLAPLALIVMVAAAAPPGRRAARSATFLAALLPLLMLLAWIQDVRYGSPLASGYGTLRDGFAIANVGPNLLRYPRWLTASHSWFPWLAVLAPLLLGRTMRRLPFWSLLAVITAVWAAYLPYAVFGTDEWSYTRFLLPALPGMLLLSSLAALGLLARIPTALRAPGLAIFIGVVCTWSGAFARAHGVFTFEVQERRYPAAAGFVRARADAGFVVAGQHSGSVRYYAGRPTLRWDMLDPASLDRALGELRGKGYVPYAVLDESEDREFRQRFAGQQGVVALVPLAVFGQTRVYGFE